MAEWWNRPEARQNSGQNVQALCANLPVRHFRELSLDRVSKRRLVQFLQGNGMPSFPLSQLYFYLTEGCNLACRHCWLAPKLDPAAAHYPTLPVDLFTAILAEAKPLGLTSVKLTGGEPLLHPQVARLLEAIRREELGLIIETNGVLLTPVLAAEIARAKRPFISVSLDGADAATHEWVRGVPGSFEAATRAVRLLAEAGLRPQVIFSIMRCNVAQVEAIVRLAEALGAASVKFNLIQPTARGEQLHERAETLTIAELIQLGRRVDTALSATTKLKLHFDYPMAFRPLSRLAGPNGPERCGVLGILGVLASGHYALCGIGENVPDLVFGQAEQDTLAAVWNDNATLNALRAGLPSRLGGICGWCLLKTRCLGACIAQNYYRSHDLLAPFWFCEMAEAEGLFPASRRA
jgi:SynChlorMet cassette radical SAM/SPASM protein ScmF